MLNALLNISITLDLKQRKENDMDYEEKYKEALYIANHLYKEAKSHHWQEAKNYTTIFPELAESEDERIRKDIISFLKVADRFMPQLKKDVCIAWLEKQKPYGQREECRDCQFNYAGQCKGYCELKREKQKPVEWSDDDEENLQHSIAAIHAADYYTLEDKKEMEMWLKSLKQRMGGKDND